MIRQPAPTRRPAADLRLALPALAAWGSAGLALTRSPRIALAQSVIALVLALAVAPARWLWPVLVVRRHGAGGPSLGGRRPTWPLVVVGCLLCAAGAGVSAAARVAALRTGPLPALARAQAESTMRLVVTGDPRLTVPRIRGEVRRADLVVVPARAEQLRTAGQVVRLRQPVLVLASGTGWLSLLPSQGVTADVRLAPPRAGDLVAAVLYVRGSPRAVGAPSGVQRIAGRLRAGLRAASAPLPSAERGLLPGLVLGDVSRLDPDVRADFRTTGMTHLVAVSGANVAIVLAAVLLVARRLRAGPRLALTVCGTALLAFVVLARPEPSVVRAAVMGAIALVGTATGRPRASMSALCATVLVLVLADPPLARSPGFALSVLATGGLLVLAPGWRDRLARRLPMVLAQAIAIPAAAQVACGPVIAVIAGQLSLVAIPANALAEVAVAPATILGVLAAVTAPVSLEIARLLARCAQLPTAWLVTVARVGARLPGAAISWPAGITGGLLMAAATGAVLWGARHRRLRRTSCAGLAGVAVMLVGLHVLAPAWPPPGWALVVCDVGQGDALVLSAGPHAALLVDTGPDPALVDRCLRTLGVRELPLVVLTHLHADHVEGLPAVLAGRRVGELEIGPLDEPAEELRRVRRWAAAAGVPVRRAELGETGQLPGLRWRVLAPAAAFHGTDSDPNNSSIVLHVQLRGFAALLTGDVEPPAQQALLDSGADLRADLLKVPHHGSDHQDPAFLAAVGARVAVASVGAGNPYGHPSQRTLGEVRGDGARSYRTDRDGAVAVLADGSGLRVVASAGRGTPPLAPGSSPAAGQRPAAIVHRLSLPAPPHRTGPVVGAVDRLLALGPASRRTSGESSRTSSRTPSQRPRAPPEQAGMAEKTPAAWHHAQCVASNRVASRSRAGGGGVHRVRGARARRPTADTGAW